MKKVALLGFGLMVVSAAANAISFNGSAGQDYTHLGFGLGTETSGLAMTGGWTHNDDDGDAASLGLGLNIPLGPFLATVGGKGIYTNPKDGDEGYAAAVGGGLQAVAHHARCGTRLLARPFAVPQSPPRPVPEA